ncbi:LysM peptidoglycan-binding domain-containing protein [Sporosarcina cascadiensis]|uniref:LysM peptidoglycan-binding domain-containing protein n=1 Tax=Sporosarcina cascadiensis TaxID=2660747 RepID=UPI00129AC4B2|nr:LysM peptidoglycan-binding domain-containing protein [Sporosarcina cascadiensis]
MKKNQYEEDFEQQRKEIIVEESKEIPSRTEVHQSKKKEKKNRTKLINIILAVFTLIPIVILIYVLSDLYSPSVPNQVPVEKAKVSISSNTAVKEDEPKADDTKKPAVVVNPEKPVEQQKKPAEKPADPPKKEPVQKQPAQKPVQKPEPKPEPKPKPKPVEKPVQKPVQSAKSHVVKSNETLYRISVNYYGDGSHVQKIQQANGLSSNEIHVGQTLVLP